MITCYVTIPTAPLSGSAFANSLGSGEYIHVYVVLTWLCGILGNTQGTSQGLPRPAVIESSSHAGDSGYSLLLRSDFLFPDLHSLTLTESLETRLVYVMPSGPTYLSAFLKHSSVFQVEYKTVCNS